MTRLRSLFGLTLLTLLVVSAAAGAQEDDPVFYGRRLSEWLGMLKGEGKAAEDRQAALFVLGNSGGLPSMWPELVKTRMAGLTAVRLIGPAKSPKVLPAVLAALRDDPEPRLRESAALALGQLIPKARDEKIRIDDARDTLISAMRTDKAGVVRQAAATALGQLGPDADKGVLSLGKALKDPHAETQAAAAASLHRLATQDKLGAAVAEALPDLLAVIRDPKGKVPTRLYSIMAVGGIGPDAAPALPALVEVMTDARADPDLRAAAAEAIGRLGSKGAAEAVPVLAKTLTASDSPLGLRRAAAAALDQFGTDAAPALAALRQALKDGDKFVRCTAMHAVGGLGKELGMQRRDVVTALLACLNDTVLEVRVAAIETFGNLGPEALGDDLKAVVDKLTEAARDSRKDVKEAAQNALKKLKPAP
jgi:HEAT repeat protein